MEFVDKIIEFLNSLSPMIIGAIGIAFEFVLRMLKTDEPKSIMWVIHSVLKKVCALAEALAGMLDKILPQNVKK